MYMQFNSLSDFFILKDLLQTEQKEILELLEVIASVTITNFEEIYDIIFYSHCH